MRIDVLSVLALTVLPATAAAATFTVGPPGSARQYTQLAEVFANNDLGPGDVVEVDGGAGYDGGIVVGADDGGSAESPVVIRWRRDAGATRPVLSGGQHTIKFEQSSHVVLDGFDVRGGSRSCIFSEAHDITVRDSIIQDCPSHGILGADQNSGSFTLEYSEVARSGSGTNRHSIYMQNDQVAWPGSVFRMQHNYVHSATGGLLVKVRHSRAEIYYNWLEGSEYGELELIGPDCETQKPGWTADLEREDADVVGNVLVHTAQWRNAVRIGGDLNGRSQGRVRMVNNTIVFHQEGQANAVMVQLGAGSLEMHNNVIHKTGGRAPAIVRENPASDVDTPICGPRSRDPWTRGRKVAGSNNWVQTTATLVPPEWSATVTGADPRWANAGAGSLAPGAGSPLIDAGNNAPATPAEFPFPRPLLVPAFEPPEHKAVAPGAARERARVDGAVDIGAFEAAAGPATRPRPRPPSPRVPLEHEDGAAESPSALASAFRTVRGWVARMFGD